MRRLALLALILVPAPARADLLGFASRGDFDASSSGVTTETFASGRITNSNVTGPIAGPGEYRDASGNLVFAEGELAEGFSINTENVFLTSNLRLYEASPGGAIFVGVPGDYKITVDFDVPATAVGLDIYSVPSRRPVSVLAYGSEGSLLGTHLVHANPTTPTFVGLAATGGDAISRLVIDDLALSSSSPGLGNLSFGTLASTGLLVPLSPVPEPGSLAMAALGLAAAGLVAIRAR